MIEMDDANLKMMQLSGKKYCCSQVLIIMGLENRNEDNPSLVRAMHGLGGGCGLKKCSCGALTGGCCLLALYAGRGSDEEEPSEAYASMLEELNHWFFETYENKYGSVICSFIRDFEDGDPPQKRCFEVVSATYFKCLEILASHGFDFNG